MLKKNPGPHQMKKCPSGVTAAASWVLHASVAQPCSFQVLDSESIRTRADSGKNLADAKRLERVEKARKGRKGTGEDLKITRSTAPTSPLCQETASQPNEGSDAQRRCRLHMFQARLCHLGREIDLAIAITRCDQGVTKAWRHSHHFAPLNGTMKPKSSTVASFPTKCKPWPTRTIRSNEQKDGVPGWENSAKTIR